MASLYHPCRIDCFDMAARKPFPFLLTSVKIYIRARPLLRRSFLFIEVTMPNLMLVFLMFLMPLTLTACDTAYLATMEKMGYAKRDILSSRVKSARDAQEDAKKEI